MTDFYTWTATGSGDWITASNWFDVTADTPAATAPGTSDSAEIDNPGTTAITVTGPADAAGLSVTGQVTLAGSYDIGAFVLGCQPFPPPYFSQSMTSTIVLAGTFNAGSLSVGGISFNAGFYTTPVIASGLLEVGSGALLSAGTVALNAGDLQVDGGAADIAGGLTLGSDVFPEPGSEGFALAGGSLDITNHGSVQLGGLAITEGSVSLDATSTLEIGDAGTAAAGTITVDPGAEITVGDFNSYVIQSIHNAETATVAAPILNNGSIETDMNLSGVINNGVIDAGTDTLSYISGNGLVEMSYEGTIGPGDSGTFDVEFAGTIVVALGSGVPIDTADTPMIQNFGTNKAIVLQGISADAATYTVTGLGIGTLTLDDGATQVASLTMLGAYGRNAFSVVSDGSDSVLTLNTAAAVANSYSWVATGSGDWSTAGNWFDVTTDTPAAAAPGPGDTAEIDNTGTGIIMVTGPGNALDLSVSGNVTLAGDLGIGALMLAVPPSGSGVPLPGVTTQTITLTGDVAAATLTVGSLLLVPGLPSQQSVDYGVVAVDAGAILSAGSAQVVAGDLLVDNGTASIGGWLTLGTVEVGVPGQPTPPLTSGSLDVTDHGSVQLGTLAIMDGSVNLDSTSTLEIGGAGTATAGTISVDPGASLLEGTFDEPDYPAQTYGTVTISALILNYGIIFADHDLSNVVNNGIIYSDHGATLSFISGDGHLSVNVGGTIGPDVSGTLDFVGENTIVFAPGADVPTDTADTPQISQFGAFGDTYATIILQGITADGATYAATGTGIGTLTLDDDGTPVASLTMLGTYASDAFTVIPGSGESLITAHTPPAPPCFAAGTRIATPRGNVAVEALVAGDDVMLASGGSVPIVWIGRRRADCRSHPKPGEVWPVRIRRGAFAPGAPNRDLFLSPDHAVYAEGVLIPIKYLINGDTIRQVERKTVTYFHLELPAHDVLLADGLAVESYLDTGDRNSFANGGRVVSLFPSFSLLVREAYGYAPLVVTGPALDAVRRRIEMQAGRVGAERAHRKRGKAA